jgi:hypothetical protein
MSMRALAWSLAALAASAIAGPVAAQSYGPIVDPVPVIDGFGATCLNGFPDLQAIAKTALAGGWIERKAFVPRDSSLAPDTQLPRMLQKAEMMLILARYNPSFPKAPLSCQVTAMAKGRPDVRAFAALASGRLHLDPAPIWSGKDDDLTAEWAAGPGQVIHLSVSRYGKVRSFSMQLRKMGSVS